MEAALAAGRGGGEEQGRGVEDAQDREDTLQQVYTKR